MGLRSPLPALVFCAAILAFAQSRDPAAPAGELRGKVLDSVTGAGIPAATVQLRDEGSLIVAEVRAEANGEFVFTNIPRGPFIAHPSKSGYANLVPPETHSSATIAARNNRPLELSLTKTGVIAGRVLDSYGRPPQGATVVAVIRRMTYGQVRFIALGRGVPVNADGGFRLFGLHPGWYAIAALAPDRSTGSTQASVYFPGVVDAQRAEFVHLDAGQTRDDTYISVPPIERHNVSGTVTGIPAGWQGTAVSILPEGSLSVAIQTVRTNEQGAFRFEAVPTGRYQVYAAGPVRGRGPDGPDLGAGAQEAAVSVEVGFRDVEGVRLNLEEGFTVQASILADPLASPLPDCARNAQLTLERAGPNPYKRRWYSSVGENGEYRVEFVPRGEYQAVLYGLRHPCYLRRLVSGERSLQNQAITVDGNSDWKLVLDTRRGDVEGAVLDEKGEPAPRARVFLVPIDEIANTVEGARTAVALDTGRYRIERVVPARYRLLAVPAGRTIDHFDPARWSELGAIEIRVEPGATLQAETIVGKPGGSP